MVFFPLWNEFLGVLYNCKYYANHTLFFSLTTITNVVIYYFLISPNILYIGAQKKYNKTNGNIQCCLTEHTKWLMLTTVVQGFFRAPRFWPNQGRARKFSTTSSFESACCSCWSNTNNTTNERSHSSSTCTMSKNAENT